MGTPRLPRWAACALGLLVVGALFLMHGIDASPVAATAPPAEHTHADEAPHEHGGDCDCPGAHHLLAACVAVAVTVGSGRFLRRTKLNARVRWSRLGLLTSDRSLFRLREVLRPPDPAWVRLGVMRC